MSAVSCVNRILSWKQSEGLKPVGRGRNLTWRAGAWLLASFRARDIDLFSQHASLYLLKIFVIICVVLKLPYYANVTLAMFSNNTVSR